MSGYHAIRGTDEHYTAVYEKPAIYSLFRVKVFRGTNLSGRMRRKTWLPDEIVDIESVD